MDSLQAKLEKLLEENQERRKGPRGEPIPKRWAIEVDAPGAPMSAFVMNLDVDADEGNGVMSLVPVSGEAVTFLTPGEANRYMIRRSSVAPTRADGQPNRSGGR